MRFAYGLIVLSLAALTPAYGDVQGNNNPALRSAPGARGATLTTKTPAARADRDEAAGTRACEPRGVWVQVLGSGGPELAGGRASASYLVWIDGKARALVDLGGGAMLRFGETGARIADLDVILFTHLHVDHSADLPALVKASFFEERTRVLPIYGPPGNRLMPSTVSFVRELFSSTNGVFRYLGGLVNPMTRDGYKLQPHDVLPPRKRRLAPRSADTADDVAFANERLRASAAGVVHGELPALAWRIQAGGKTVVFSGDTNGEGGLTPLAAGADLLVVHHAITEGAPGAKHALHMPPSVIGQVAREAKVKQLVLAHRMRRTLGREDEAFEHIRRQYPGPAVFANDLDCFAP
jgi:ribonuclease BN (tRNA processing enzyme)